MNKLMDLIKKRVNDDNKTGFALIKAGLMIFGIFWRDGKPVIHLIYPAVTLALLVLIGILMIIDITSVKEINSEKGLIRLIKFLVPFFSLAFASIKLLIFHLLKTRMFSAMALADRLGQKENELYYKYSDFNTVSKGFFMGIIASVFGIIISGTLETGLPIHIYWPLPKAGLPYFAAIFSCTTAVIIVGVVHFTTDIFLSQLTGHVVYQARKMRYFLERIGIRKEEDQQLLQNAWHTHINILKLVNDIRRSYSLFLLLQGVYTVTHSSVVIFAMVKVTYIPFLLAHAMPMMITGYAQLLVYCHSGETMKTEMEKVFFAAYDNHWHQSERRTQKCLNVMLLVCRRPVELRSYGMFTANFTTYMLIVRESFSYLVALRKLTAPLNP